MARPWTQLPPGSRDALNAMAATTGLKESTAAAALGIPLRDFRKIIANDERSKDIWQEAMAIERDQLVGVMYQKALDGDQKAAAFLLASRHGLSEKTPELGNTRGVNITFALPAALDAASYLQAITPKVEALTDGN